MPSSSAYAGYVPRAGDAVAVEPASLSAHDMWERYIAPRKPVVLNGLLDDPQWRGTSWTDLAHLRQQAGDAVVRVEPVHPQEDCFGTATPRTTMTFAEYLDTLQHDTAGKYYLTTQYELDEPPASDDLDAGPGLDTLLPTPTHRLLPDFPLHPRLLGRLVLQQCNLWLGNSHQPKSSGLHHDFHDNLYILLSGHKRFVLFPPSAHDTLALRGSVQRVHPNGLIVYEDPGRIRADGLDALDAAHWRVAARARTLHARPTKRARGANNEAQAAYDDAKDTFLLLRETYDDADGAAAWDSADEGDVNALEEGDGDEEDEEDEEEDGDGDEDEEEDEDEDEGDDDDDDDDALGGDRDDGKTPGAARANGTTTPTDTPQEPPSFSRIKPHALHTHFLVEPPIPAPHPDASPLVPGPTCPAPLVVDLEPGQMLYLPASWFHEVTSWASPDAPHMAFNYWMHPPDGRTYDAPYADAEVWDEVRRHVEQTQP